MMQTESHAPGAGLPFMDEKTQRETRYSRQIMLPEFGESGQAKLSESSALIVGVGGLGSTLATLLCAAGIGRLVLADGDRVSLSNLQRQILYRTDQIGLYKSACAEETLRRLNPEVVIESHCRFMDETNACKIAEGCQIVLDGCDNPQARYLMNDLCVGFGIPYVYGSISGFQGQVSVFNRTKGSATYRCLFPQPESQGKTGAIPEETEGTPNAGIRRLPGLPSGVLGPLPSLIASIQANECLKILSGCGPCLDNELFLFDMQTLQARHIGLQPSESGREASLKSFSRFCPHSFFQKPARKTS